MRPTGARSGLSRRALLALGFSGTAGTASSASDPLAGRFGGAFALTTHDGRQVSDESFRGRFMLIYFGYTHCPDLCPIDLALIGAALDSLGEAADAIQPLFVSVDPERDTPAVLAPFVASFHKRLIGLTGSEADIAAVARLYRVHRVRYQPASAAPGDYAIDHGSLTCLMGGDGQLLTLSPHNTEAARMAAMLRRYLTPVDAGRARMH
jgi:protein SCO1/2